MDIVTHPILAGTGSFLLLAFASYCVGEGGEILGQKYDASVIGGLLIAWLNTAPETIFFISALRANNPRFAIGAVSGSTIVNLTINCPRNDALEPETLFSVLPQTMAVVGTVAIGVCLFLGSRARKAGFVRLQPQVKSQALILAVTSIFPLYIALFGYSMLIAVLGILAYVAFLVYTLIQSKKPVHPVSNDVEKAGGHLPGDSDDEEDGEEEEAEQPLWKGIAYLTVGGSFIFLFSEPFITAVSSLASSMNVNPTLLAFFLAPIASEMPEILESVSLSIKGNTTNLNIAVSNLIGGTITKTTLLMGIFCIYGLSMNLAFETPNFSISMLLMLLCSCAAGGITAFAHRPNKQHAYILFGLFAFTCIVQYMANHSSGSVPK